MTISIERNNINAPYKISVDDTKSGVLFSTVTSVNIQGRPLFPDTFK